MAGITVEGLSTVYPNGVRAVDALSRVVGNSRGRSGMDGDGRGPSPTAPDRSQPFPTAPATDLDDTAYASLVAHLKTHIVAGDVFQIAWVAVDADGRVKASNQTSVNVPVRTAVRRSDVVGLYDVLELPDSAKTLRIAVSSGAARQSGTVHLPIERIEPGTFAASPLLIGLDGGDGRQLARLSSRASASTFPPATTRTFNRNRRLRVFSLVTEKPTIAALRLSTPDDRLVNTIPVAQSASADVAGAVDLKAAVELSRLAPGQYVLELVVTNPKADQVRRAVAFEVR